KMNKYLLIALILLSGSLTFAEDFNRTNHIAWVNADPDTIYADDNITYSEITVMVVDDDSLAVEGAHVYFDPDIGNCIYHDVTNNQGIAESTFWDSGDVGVATITITVGDETAYVQVVILPLVSVDEAILDESVFYNYPNPFNPSTTISFNLTAEVGEDAEISIYNMKGQKIKSFPISQFTNSPVNQITWNGTDENNQPVSSGIYFYKLRSGKFEVSRKMLLMK
ncbi:MAG: T9SS type A sorting domain-containing protein, partial [Candidatus Cloacimonetes bacterium]|nr:T9SS type A sorting domain-containing protein [Candidatus Cloacimonadota bacterium]